MKIELRKVSHENKGAELMLRAMVDHFVARPGVTLAGRLQVGPRVRRVALGIRPLLYMSNRAWFATTPRWFPPRVVRERLGLVHPADLDFVLDASGFAYGDQWGPDRALQAAAYFRYVRGQGAKVVLMPQSFGPFEDLSVRRAVEELLAEADLVFPRDATSMRCVGELCGASERIIQSPDFTPLVNSDAPVNVDLPENAAAVVPNQKMIAMTGTEPGAYEAFIVDVIELFREHGLSPFFLIHATEDRALVDRIRAGIAGDVPVIQEDDALLLKSIIGRCRVAMCSRFHALVSALCQGVPSVATGWSHKYQHLLEEYHCPEALFDVRDNRKALRDRIAEMLTPERHAELAGTLQTRAEWHRSQARSMWDRIDALVGTSS